MTSGDRDPERVEEQRHTSGAIDSDEELSQRTGVEKTQILDTVGREFDS